MATNLQTVAVACPAKVNLTLAVLGPRGDGFHALESVVAQTEFGDELTLGWAADASVNEDAVVVEGALIPESDNSVQRAISLFRSETGFTAGAYHGHLRKRITVGAGLGGGSSDAAATLKALQVLHKDAGIDIDWMRLAQRLGSDCSLFMHEGPVLMRGRGEEVTALEDPLAERLRGQPVILFKPAFSISTVEAYQRLARSGTFTPAALAERHIHDWAASEAVLPAPLNDFERLAGDWMPSLCIVLERLRTRHGLDARLSGSGSACFAFSPDGRSATNCIREEARRAWGPSFWVQETYLK